MNNLVPELSPDLEWMLESGQASPEMLAEALVREYWQPVYRFGLALSGDPRLAEQLALESLSAALIQAYSYRGGAVVAWLFKIVLKIGQRKRTQNPQAWNGWLPLRTKDEKDEESSLANSDASKSLLLWNALAGIRLKNRLPFLFIYLNGWPPELVAEIFKTSPKTIAAQLRIIRRRLIETLSAAGYPLDDLAYEKLDDAIRALLEERLPNMALGSEKVDEVVAVVLSGAEQQRSSRRRLASFKEFILIAIVIALAAGLIYGGNMLFPEPEPTQAAPATIAGTQIVKRIATSTTTRIATPTVTPTQTPLPPPATLEPLTLQASSDEIKNRIYLGRYAYEQLWIDALITFYGPQGYAGEPQPYRIQIWIDNSIPAGALLGGAPGAKAEEIALNRSGVGYWSEMAGSPPFTVHKMIGQQSLRSGYAADLVLYQPTRLVDAGNFLVIGREELLDRQSLIVDYLSLAGKRVATLWIDAQTGLALRQRYYATTGDDLSLEIRMLDMQIDPDIPADLFYPQYPWSGAFARNSSNQAISQGRTLPNFYLSALQTLKPFPFVMAPDGFDPSGSELFFQIAQVYYEPPNFTLPPVLYHASVFSDDYFLGNLDFENPWELICDRSPDGQRLAIAGQGLVDRSRMRWFDLSHLNSSNGSAYLDDVTQFAFAPDSRRLALFASHEPYGSISILDTDSNQMTHLLDLPDARSFVWSPDGEFLAMIGRVNLPLIGDEVIVVNTNTGAISYRKSVDYGTGNIGDWPPLKWGVEFPAEMHGLAQCALPPNEP